MACIWLQTSIDRKQMQKQLYKNLKKWYNKNTGKEFMKKHAAKKNRLTQWHPAFCSAIRLELRSNKDQLEYRSEYGINTKPIQIDLLVVQKVSGVKIQNEIGHIFKIHNILEYKSPDDGLTIDVFFKAMAYVCLYKASAGHVDQIKAQDMTVTLVRHSYPRELFKALKALGFRVKKYANGIYHIGDVIGIEIQIVVSRQLDPKNHIWLRALTREMTQEEAEDLIHSAKGLSEQDEKELMASVMQVATKENHKLFVDIKEVPYMCEALRELMKTEIDQEIRDAVAVKNAEIADKDAEIARIRSEKEAAFAEIEALKAQLAAMHA